MIQSLQNDPELKKLEDTFRMFTRLAWQAPETAWDPWRVLGSSCQGILFELP